MLNFIPDVKFIRSHFSEEQIFSLYGIPITNNNFSIPFLNDGNPSCFFYKHKGKLYIKDFGSNLFIDIFACALLYHKYVHDVDYQIDDRGTTTKDAYYEIAPKLIWEDMINSKYEVQTFTTPKSFQVKDENTLSDIKFDLREFTEFDKDYWLKFGINLQQLKDSWIFPVKNVWVNGEYKQNLEHILYNPTYAIWSGIGNKCKIYKPLAKKHNKWRGNNNNDYLLIHKLVDEIKPRIITSGVKDAMALEFLIGNEFEIYCINSETRKPRYIYANTKLVIGDNDEQGIKMTNYYQSSYNVITMNSVYKDIANDVNYGINNKCINDVKEYYLNNILYIKKHNDSI